ncbi:uncharacterized protein TRIADDRAFT_54135 [Trichoplax adhaerens]|uniref:Alkaline phosphatase n=1 Tax=Trichoplax adhaerens TaxID=10228 RepID=B3RR75_TRIAD|nr:hypothetical protein TRIADDRAFT_54135 [Trichoplax adhaerens]EDV26295.1 hypothetical protein TRIADDRAFT_54135 [Trichoplax adhaerens]|eukprot:XP_002110291.1 hypothetical protein TRIADDRAFT_54135 [Trichoplax adhaerens]
MSMAHFLLILASLSWVSSQLTSPQINSQWYKDGENVLKQKLNAKNIEKTGKNAILFIGDGMSIPTEVCARIFQGQKRGQTGEENNLSWQLFPNVGLSKTYSVDFQVPDSAATATAFLSGVKTNDGVLGLNQNGIKGQCASEKNNHVNSLVAIAEELGMSTGIITTARVTHATPGAAYSHCASRNWEANIPSSQAGLGCKDIATQLLDAYNIGDGFEVVMGGGRCNFHSINTTDPEYTTFKGCRFDGKDLIQEWKNKKLSNSAYVWNLTAFNAIDPNKTDHLLGLFDPSHMKYDADRLTDKAGEPSIAQMTEKAIQILQRNPKGYFLFVEGGRIDHSHHSGVAYGAITDTIAMADAVQKAVAMTNPQETLIVVTADHGHTLSMSGYPKRGNPILGLVDGAPSLDGKPYTTINYANGPGAIKDGELRPNLTGVDVQARLHEQQAIFPIIYETHDGADVGIYSQGPFAHLLTGVVEQSYIFHAMKHALCLGPNSNVPNCQRFVTRGSAVSSVASNMLLLVIMLCLVKFLQ